MGAAGAQRRGAAGKNAKNIQMDGEDEAVDVHTSLETGEPMTPPDRLTPEKG
jgi:hypothetical protein